MRLARCWRMLAMGSSTKKGSKMVKYRHFRMLVNDGDAVWNRLRNPVFVRSKDGARDVLAPLPEPPGSSRAVLPPNAEREACCCRMWTAVSTPSLEKFSSTVV